MTVDYDVRLSLACITGPGGFTQIQMTEQAANALAYVIGAKFALFPENV